MKVNLVITVKNKMMRKNRDRIPLLMQNKMENKTLENDSKNKDENGIQGNINGT